MPDLEMSRAVLRLAMKAGGAGGLRRDFDFVTDLGFWILVMSDDSTSGSYFPSRDSFEHPRTAVRDLNVL